MNRLAAFLRRLADRIDRKPDSPDYIEPLASFLDPYKPSVAIFEELQRKDADIARDSVCNIESVSAPFARGRME